MALSVPLFLAENLALRTYGHVHVEASVAMEGDVGQAQLEVDADLLDHLVPAFDSQVAVVNEVVSQACIQGIQRRMLDPFEASIDLFQDGADAVCEMGDGMELGVGASGPRLPGVKTEPRP